MPRHKFLLLAALLSVIAIACSFSLAKPTPTPLPTATFTPRPTSTFTPLPTATFTPSPTFTLTPRPTKQPTPTLSPYFVEDFSKGLGAWDFFYVGPHREDKVTFIIQEDGLLIDISIENMYVYFDYPLFTYKDVSLEMSFTNQGVNSQNVGLVCRLSDKGWYEFSVGSDGLWYLFAFSREDGYTLLANGGSFDVNMGKQSNRYAMTCQDDKISLYINGNEVKGSPVSIAHYQVSSNGFVGFNVSSLGSYPVITVVHEFRVDEP